MKAIAPETRPQENMMRAIHVRARRLTARTSEAAQQASLFPSQAFVSAAIQHRPSPIGYLATRRIWAQIGAVELWERSKKMGTTIRGLNKLSTRAVDDAADGSWSDGGGLYLSVGGDGKRRSWVFRFTSPVTGKVREMGLGRAGAGGVPLKAARAERDRLIAVVRSGLDPLAERERRKAEQAAKHSFGEVAAMTIAKQQSEWKDNERNTSRQAWTRSLTVNAAKLANRPVDEITVDEVKQVVAPMANEHPVAARLTLARIAMVFDYAIAHGWAASNPASWSIFRHILPSRPPGAKKHHRALDWREAPAIIAGLRQRQGMAVLAFEFMALTGVRVSEARLAEFSEFDFQRAIWEVPPKRMKRSLPHAVPLSDRALAIVTALHERARSGSKFVFPGYAPRRPLSRSMVTKACAEATGGRASPHGWRSTFRSWMADHGVEFEVAESILAHSAGGVVESYQRSQMIERKRPWMQKWADFLVGKGSGADNVVDLPSFIAARRA
jgi:integrase